MHPFSYTILALLFGFVIGIDDSNSEKHFSKFLSEARIKRQNDLQERLSAVKATCVKDMGLPEDKGTLILSTSQNPSLKEKCLLACMLRRLGLLTNSNKLSTKGMINLANRLTNNNPLVAGLAVVACDKCNREVSATSPCEAAFLINNCITKELRYHGVNVEY